MKAVVLAAGLGTRLGPMTAETPKAALPIGGRPMIAHILGHLARCGFDQAAVNLHYRSRQVREAVESIPDLGVDVVWFSERDLLGTAGALRPMHGFLGDSDAFLVHYGDVLTDHDLGGMLNRHRDRRALMTLLVHERPHSNSVVVVGDDSRVISFLERPSDAEREGVDSHLVNSGVYACSRDVLQLVPASPCDVARDLVPLALAVGTVFVERVVGYRCAVDSPTRAEEAEQALADGRWRSALV
jgi:mannose-1-phosphate guanylyltransferase